MFVGMVVQRPLPSPLSFLSSHFSQSQPFLPSFALCHQSLRLRVFVHCGIRSTLATLATSLALTLSDRLLAKQSRTGLRCHSLLNCVGVLGHSASGFGLEGLNTVRERILPRRNLPAAQLRKFPSARKTDADEDGDGRTVLIRKQTEAIGRRRAARRRRLGTLASVRVAAPLCTPAECGVRFFVGKSVSAEFCRKHVT